MKTKLKIGRSNQKVAQIIAHAQHSVKGRSSAQLKSRGLASFGSIHIFDVILPGI